MATAFALTGVDSLLLIRYAKSRSNQSIRNIGYRCVLSFRANEMLGNAHSEHRSFLRQFESRITQVPGQTIYIRPVRFSAYSDRVRKPCKAGEQI
jgi:hypothetical protein